METLELLGVALGFATLSGINLYLTVFVTGLAIQMNWITLADRYQQLEVLGDPAIITIAGIFYFLEFFADKVPWVDSLWDSIHTVIRPIGGAMLAITALGQTSEVYNVMVALLGGGVALTTHSLKAGTRLVVNSSPEPFSNMALSVAEDVGVLAGLGLVFMNPIVALIVFLILLAFTIYITPKMFRFAKVIFGFLWKKFTAAKEANPVLQNSLPPDFDMLFESINAKKAAVEWAVPCTSGRSRLLKSHLSGYLIATIGEPDKLYFVAQKRWKDVAQVLDLTGFKAVRETRFLSENLVLYQASSRSKYVFLFDRSKGDLVQKLADHIQRRRGQTPAQDAKSGSRLEGGEVYAT